MKIPRKPIKRELLRAHLLFLEAFTQQSGADTTPRKPPAAERVIAIQERRTA